VLLCGLTVLLCATAGQSEPPASAAKKGELLLNKEDIDGAISAYTEAIRANPKDADLYKQRGDAYLAKDDYKKALADFEVVEKLIKPIKTDFSGAVVTGRGGSTAGTWVNAVEEPEREKVSLGAIRVSRSGCTSEDIDRLTKAIRLGPKDARAYLRRGSAYRNCNDLEKAIIDLTKAIELAPKLLAAYYERAEAYAQKKEKSKAQADIRKANLLLSNGDVEGAIADYTHAIRLGPKDAELYYRRGLAYDREGDFGNAIADISEAIRLNPKYAEAFFSRGFVYDRDRNIEMAIGDYNEAIRLNPTVSEWFCQRGHAWFLSGEYDKAIADLTEAIRLDPKDADSYCLRAKIYLDEKRDFRKAIADCTEALRGYPESGSLHDERGKAYFGQGNLDSAIADFSEAVRLGNARSSWWLDAATARKADPGKAAADFKAGKVREPDLHGPGRVILGNGGTAEELAELGRSVPVGSKDATAYLRRGSIYRSMGAWEKAIADLTKAIELAPKLLAAYYERAEAYAQKGEKARAKADIEQAERIAAGQK
jgi:tetratricopeptide (TPR) repeat protein